MAREYEHYLQRGATIAAIVIDPPPQNAAMAEKLALPFPILADPGGASAIKHFDVWDAAGNMAKPAIIVLAPDGREVYRYTGIDFMDRPDDGDMLAALDALGLRPIDAPIATVPVTGPAPGPRAMSLANLAVYMRGVRFATQALAARARDTYHRGEAERTAKMAERFIAAQAATLRTLESP